ncbi:MAG TPA: AMP-binding protein [Pseudonocardia sp.]
MSAPTIAQAFADTVAARPGAPALRGDVGDHRELTWAGYADRACRVAAWLERAGFRRGAGVGLLMESRPEFHIADMGAMLAGGVPVSLSTQWPVHRVRHLLRRARAEVLFAESDRAAERVLAGDPGLPELRQVVVLDGTGPDVRWQRFGRMLDGPPVGLAAAAGRVRPADPATVLPDSSEQDAVLLSQANLVAGVRGCAAALGSGLAGLRTLSALPMTDIAGRLTAHYAPAVLGIEVATCADPAELDATIARLHPELLALPACHWEDYRAVITASLAGDPGRCRRFASVKRLGRELRRWPADGAVARARWRHWHHERAETVEPLLRSLGLDALRAASYPVRPEPLSELTADFFLDLGVPLAPHYGRPEASGAVTWDPHDVVVGTVGKPLPVTRVKISPAGEVLLRGPAVFSDYLGGPARSAFDPDGWFRTGDIGQFDGRGNLRILGRRNASGATRAECPSVAG